jgi:hypothetical protein
MIMHRKFSELIGNPTPLIGVEVGVHRGENAKAMLSLFPELFLFMVDHWRFRGESIDEEYCKDKSFVHGGRENYDLAVKNTDEYAHRRAIIPLDSLTVADLIEENSLDFVFLDADHRYKGVSADLHAWYSPLKNGGIMFGHDIRSFKDVRAAVDDFCGENGIHWEVTDGCFYFRK